MASRGQRAFHSSSFRYLFFGRLLTVLGNGIAPIALAFAVLDIGGSATDLGLVVAARSSTLSSCCSAVCWRTAIHEAWCWSPLRW